MIHIVTPYREDRNLGRAYNEAFENCPEGDWLCLTDIDVLFLTPDAPRVMYEAIGLAPNAIFTCYTNRISPLAKEQSFFLKPNDVDSIQYHQSLAQKCINDPHPLYLVGRTDLSGFLLLVSKDTWKKYPFPEYMDKGGCIGVDTMWSRTIRAAQVPVLRMNRLYVWHTYRLGKEINDKTHLVNHESNI